MGRDIYIFIKTNSKLETQNPIFKIGITNHCNVFLEEFWMFLNNLDSKTIKKDEYYYVPINEF